MRKRIIIMLCTLLICLQMISLEGNAAIIDPTRTCSLTLSYSRGESVFSDLTIDIYRVARLSENGEYELLEPFSTYPIKIHGITSQQEWHETAQTIKNYVTANQVVPYQTKKSDEQGLAYFVGLETGLYMVKGTMAQDSKGTVIFHDFMVYLPTPVENDYDYDIEAKPKYTEYTKPEQYTVVKLWKDAQDLDKRPQSIRVEILKDGEVQESVTLSGENNWSYSWEVLDGEGVWSVVERDVPEGYQVSITKDKTVFVITNSIPDEPDPEEPEVPPTGDTSPLLLYVIILCVSGGALILLVALRLKDRGNDKK